MAMTISDIAKKAGVSVSTVSRVINNKGGKYRISQSTQNLINSIATELNYTPNQLARGLRLKKTHTIGLVVPDISNPFFAHVTRIIQTELYKLGYTLIVCNTDENQGREIEQISLLRSKGVDGFIIMPVGLENNHIKEILDDNIPLVLLDRCFDDLDTNSVLVDNYNGAYKATKYFIDQGHHRIAIIQGLPNTSTNTMRVNGYKSALRDNSIDINNEYVVGKDFRFENGYIETKYLINMKTPPTAIFCTSDLITQGALAAIYEENFTIPEDFAIISFDDIDFGPFLKAPLTAVEQPRRMMGEMSVKLLIEDIRLKGRSEKRNIILKPNLLIRESVGQLNNGY